MERTGWEVVREKEREGGGGRESLCGGVGGEKCSNHWFTA